MPLTLFTSARFADHLTPPGHPERLERAEVMQAIAAEFRAAGGDVREPRTAAREELVRIHHADYVGLIAETAGRATALDADTFTSPDTYDVACLAAGAAVSAVDFVLAAPAGPLRGSRPTDTAPDAAGPLPESRLTATAGPPRESRPTNTAPAARRAFALVRPPGHHAEADRAMGFCFFNNIAVAAAHARAAGLERVAIVDYDVHHGNGTQWSFYTDPSVLFISSHQFPYYPGTGAATETGNAAGKGYTINLPLAAGATDADYELVYSRVAIPVLKQFRPELILISAGFDAYMDDPLGGMRLTAGCFGRLTGLIAGAADECCDGRVVAITEGGYNLQGLADSLRAAIDALDDDGGTGGTTRSREEQDREPAAKNSDTSRGEATVQAVLPALGPYWQL